MIQTLMAFIQSWPWLVDLNFITGKFTARTMLIHEAPCSSRGARPHRLIPKPMGYPSELVKKLVKVVFLLPSFEETRPRHEGNDLHQILYSHLFGKNPRLQAGKTSVLARVKMPACSNIGPP